MLFIRKMIDVNCFQQAIFLKLIRDVEKIHLFLFQVSLGLYFL